MKKVLLLFIMIYSWCSFAQQHKAVEIIEEKNGKRTLLYAQNKTDQPKSVFLKVDAQGYRRRSDRPIIQMIPAQSKALLITLIELADVESSYTYTLVVDDKTNVFHATHK